jgi:hypothetical protein
LGGLTLEKFANLQNLSMSIGLTFDAFEKDVCPLQPEAGQRLNAEINKAINYQPATIWLDRFRFGGRCADPSAEAHAVCQWCEGKNRVEELVMLASSIKQRLPEKMQLGYYAIAFTPKETPEVISSLGQDVGRLATVFDIASPMLYHHMLGKPVSYIHDHVGWLAEATGKPVLPILQVKDMPDDLPDVLTAEEMLQAYMSAIQPPSAGAAWFSWGAAVKTDKTATIKNCFENF